MINNKLIDCFYTNRMSDELVGLRHSVLLKAFAYVTRLT